MATENGGAGDFSNMGVQQLMGLYYGKLFPHQEMYKWLVYGNDSKHPQAENGFFQRREFCFTLDGDIFVRYQSFKDCQEMQAAIKDRCPAKIDIGPVYNVDPQRRAAYTGSGTGFSPMERELVFDIDLTDYDDVRTCGKEGHICTSCWPLMAAAIKILDRGLREDFGFEHIFFVFSGRRGVHCWVCDERARKLTDEQRSAIASYFSVYKGQEKGMTKLSTGLDDHPAIAAAYTILEEAFEQRILPEQQLLEDESHAAAVLGFVPEENVRADIEHEWARGGGGNAGVVESRSQRRWRQFKDYVLKAAKKADSQKNHTKAKALRKAVRDVVFAYSYPRLDLEVSKKMNHLLKAPFCVHPKTGKVCVPIHPEAAWEFDPDSVPTVASLLAQLNSGSKGAAAGTVGEDWRSTDMAAAVETFHSCFLDALQSEARSSLAAKVRHAQKDGVAW